MERLYRDRFLTPEEAARDEAVRRAVENEFPPLRPPEVAGPGTLSDTLREALRTSDRSVEAIAAEAKVSSTLVGHFMRGECDIHMKIADRLARAAGLKVAVVR